LKYFVVHSYTSCLYMIYYFDKGPKLAGSVFVSLIFMNHLLIILLLLLLVVGGNVSKLVINYWRNESKKIFCWQSRTWTCHDRIVTWFSWRWYSQRQNNFIFIISSRMSKLKTINSDNNTSSNQRKMHDATYLRVFCAS